MYSNLLTILFGCSETFEFGSEDLSRIETHVPDFSVYHEPVIIELPKVRYNRKGHENVIEALKSLASQLHCSDCSVDDEPFYFDQVAAVVTVFGSEVPPDWLRVRGFAELIPCLLFGRVKQTSTSPRPDTFKRTLDTPISSVLIDSGWLLVPGDISIEQ